MFEISQLGCGVYLCMLSVIDIRVRRLPVWILAAGGIAAGILCVYQDKIPIVLALAGAAVGLVFSGVSKVTEEGFGCGDSIPILILGIYLGFWNLLGVLVLAFLLSAVFAIFALCVHRFNRSTGYPFVPFLCISYAIWVCLGGF